MNYYNTIAKGYDELHYEEQLKKYTIIKNNLNLKKSDRLLDIACATGIARIFNCKITGIDNSEQLLKQCNGIKKVFANAENLPFPDKSFDVVTCITAIHNFDDVNKATNEMKRVSNGSIVISILKKARDYDKIVGIIKRNFILNNIVDEDKDTILFLHNKI